MTNHGRAEFLRRSLDDLEREHDAGDLTDDDYAALKAEYERRLGEPVPAAPAVPRRSTRAVAVSVVLLVVVAVGAGLLVARSTGRRDSGQTLTGNAQSEVVVTTTTLPDDLEPCLSLDGAEAIECYTAYNDAHPDDPVGLTAFGVFAIRQGLDQDSTELVEAGTGFLERAVAADAGYVPARAQLATVYLRTGDAEAARAQLAELDRLEIPADFVTLVETLRAELNG